MRTSSISRKLIAPAAVLGVVAIWWIAAAAVGRSILLPSPPETLEAVWAIMGRDSFAGALLGTLARSLLGFLAAFAGALLMAVLAGILPVIREILRPVVAVLRSLPTIAITLLALIWLKVDVAPLLICFLVVFPVMYEGIRGAIDNVDPLLLEMARVYRVRRGRCIRQVYIPCAAPYIFSAVTAAVGLSIKITVSAEVLSQPPHAMGTRMMLAKINLNTPELFGWMIVTVASSFLCEWALRLLQKRLQRRKRHAG